MNILNLIYCMFYMNETPNKIYKNHQIVHDASFPPNILSCRAINIEYALFIVFLVVFFQ